MRTLNKALTAIAISTLLFGCGYSPDSVKVADIYAGKKVQLLEKMSQEERELLNKYIARKTMRIMKYQGGKVVFDSNEVVGTGEFIDSEKFAKQTAESMLSINNGSIVANNSFVSINNNDLSFMMMEKDGQKLVVQIVRPGTEELKKLLGNVSVAEAVEEQRIYDQKMADFIEKSEKDKQEYNQQQELSKMIRIGLVEKKRYDDEMSLMFSFTNRYDKEIVAFRGIVEFYDRSGNRFYRGLISEYGGVKPKSAIIYNGEFTLNLENEDEKKLVDIPEDDIHVKFVVTDVLFKNGEVFGEDRFKSKADFILKAVETVTDGERQTVIEEIMNTN